jgi:hypothetical protein
VAVHSVANNFIKVRSTDVPSTNQKEMFGTEVSREPCSIASLPGIVVTLQICMYLFKISASPGEQWNVILPAWLIIVMFPSH